MRFKKHKRHRKIVRFYTACYGFRQPYKVLCDGTFVHHLLSNRILPADRALSNTLSAPVKLFTTRCILAELKSLGQSYSEAHGAAHKLAMARCDHERRKSAEACILEVIGEKNPEHFFVATQDADLKKKLQEIPGVPIIFGLRNSLFVEQPSASQRQFVKISEEERLHMTDFEYDLLNKRGNELVTMATNDSCDENDDLEDQNFDMQEKRKRNFSKSSGVKDKVQFKRKKAKGPNPLSCKKKRSNGNPNPDSDKIKEDKNTLKSRGRKRKRSRRAEKSSQMEGSS